MKKVIIALACATLLTSCGFNRVEPNYEGVLMTNYGRNGISDFKLVTGAQGILGPGSDLYQVPMFETKGDPEAVGITAKDGGYFTVDPVYSYQPKRGYGANIVFNYRQVGLADQATALDNIESSILNQRVTDVYREEARGYTTDSLLNNLNNFENNVQIRLKKEFDAKFFQLKALTSGLKPPASMVAAIEARNNANLQAEQVNNELKVATMQLEKSKIEAEANRVRTTGLSNANLQEQYIEMLRTTSNKVIITDGKTPVMLNQ